MKDLSNIKLGVGVPLNFTHCHVDFLDSVVSIMTTAIMEGVQMNYIRKGNGPVEVMRNIIGQTAITTGCSHIIMLDSDMWYPPDTIVKLLPQVTEDRPIVGALTFRRYPPFTPLLLQGSLKDRYKQITTYEADSLVEVDATGAGCLIFLTKILNDIPYPWFEFAEHEDGTPIGEDILFCARAREAGHRVFVDTSVKTHHLTTLHVTEAFSKLYARLMEQKEALARQENAALSERVVGKRIKRTKRSGSK